ncbi:MAG TPA: hypothetical protein VID94_10345, partial [Acidimicrobiales bacterium]
MQIALMVPRPLRRVGLPMEADVGFDESEVLPQWGHLLPRPPDRGLRHELAEPVTHRPDIARGRDEGP